MTDLEFKKEKIICKADNMNQSMIMHNIIDRKAYEKNRDIIHALYDNKRDMTIEDVMIGIKLKVKDYHNMIWKSILPIYFGG